MTPICPTCKVAPCDHGRAMCFECMEDAVLRVKGKAGDNPVSNEGNEAGPWQQNAIRDWEEGR